MPPRLRTPHRLRAAALVVAASAVVTTAASGTAAAAATPLSPTDQVVHDRLERRWTAPRLGDDLAGLVVDAETGEVIWSRTAGERQLPASTVKLVTAVNALEVFGPDHRFTTRVTTGATPRRVVLVGGGDPSLSRADLRRLAAATVQSLAATGLTSVRLDVDDSMLPAPSSAPGWKSSYTISDVSPVRALVVGQYRGWDTSLHAGRVFARMLERRGLAVRAVARGVAPEGATELAAVQGDPVSSQVRYMLQSSDNDVAELLHRMVAVGAGQPATWQGAAAAQVAVLAQVGIQLSPGSLVDGSGLSRSNRLRPREVVAVLRAAFDPARPALAGLRQGSLAVAGVSGTLAPDYLRYITEPTRCAAGLVQGKTGSLSGVIALSGLAQGADGRVKIYSFLLNRVPSTLATRRAVDKLATTVTGCW